MFNGDRFMLETFAEKHRVRITKHSGDDTRIIAGKRGHLYEYGEDLLGVMFMPPPTAGQPWGKWQPRTWNNFKRAGQTVGMTMLQDGDSEGCMGFDPENPRQSKLALKMAGIKAKRQISAATFTRLKSIGFSPRKHTQEGTSSL